MASIAMEARKIGERTYIIFVTPQWASSWHSVVCEGLSRRTRGARATGAEVARAAAARAVAATRVIRTRIQGST